MSKHNPLLQPKVKTKSKKAKKIIQYSKKLGVDPRVQALPRHIETVPLPDLSKVVTPSKFLTCAKIYAVNNDNPKTILMTVSLYHPQTKIEYEARIDEIFAIPIQFHSMHDEARCGFLKNQLQSAQQFKAFLNELKRIFPEIAI